MIIIVYYEGNISSINTKYILLSNDLQQTTTERGSFVFIFKDHPHFVFLQKYHFMMYNKII